MDRRSFSRGFAVLLAVPGIGACSQSKQGSDGSIPPSLAPASYASPAVSPMAGPSEQPSLWRTIRTDAGLSLSLPTSFSGPIEHSDWGFYTASYDLNGRDGKPVQQVVIGSLGDKQSAVAARQELRDINSFLIQGYAEVNRQSWEKSGSLVIDRVSFYHGDSFRNLLGCSWMATQAGKGVNVVTLFGAYVDDGLRNGIEESFSFS